MVRSSPTLENAVSIRLWDALQMGLVMHGDSVESNNAYDIMINDVQFY